MHTASFSDGINSFDELIIFAWKIGLTEICITDHSDATRKHFEKVGIYSNAARWSLPSYKNVQNDVKVEFWVEWDIVNQHGDTCFTIQWKDSDFCILSAHKDVYKDDPEMITQATITAIENNVERIKFIGHPTCNGQFGEYYDLPRLIEAANYHQIPLELNGKSVARGKSDEQNVRYLLDNAHALYFNSDAHNLSDLQSYRPTVAKMLLNWGYISQEEYDNFLGHFSFV